MSLDLEELLQQVSSRQTMHPPEERVANLRERVRLLPAEWDKSKFVLCGSASLAVHDIRDVNDLDVLVLPELWPQVKEAFPHPIPRGMVGVGNALEDDEYPNDDNDHALVVNGVEEQPIGGEPVDRQVTRRVELWRVHGIDFFDGLIRPVANNRQVFRDAVLWDGYLVLSLRHCLAVKALGFRDKDKYDTVKALLPYLETSERREIVTELLPEAKYSDIQALASKINEMNAQWIV